MAVQLSAFQIGTMSNANFKYDEREARVSKCIVIDSGVLHVAWSVAVDCSLVLAQPWGDCIVMLRYRTLVQAE